MQDQHTVNDAGNATAMIGRRAVLAGAMSIASVPFTSAAASIDEIAWQADAHAELHELIQAYCSSRAEDRALGEALDELHDDPECPSVSVKTSEIRPWVEITGVIDVYSDEQIVEHFDRIVNSRRSWAGVDECFEAMINQSREHGLSLIRERWTLYKEWEVRVEYAEHEQRFVDASERTDRLLEEILNFPCGCLSHAATKAQFFAEHPSVFRCYPDRLAKLLATIANPAVRSVSNGN